MLHTEHLERHIEILEASVNCIRKAEQDSIRYDVYLNAVVKGFELTLETSGKLLRKALKPYFATPKEVDVLNFKEVFRYAAKHGILTDDEVERWFLYRENRNTTAHDYGESFAEETLALTSDFTTDTKKLVERLQNVEA